MTQYKAIIRIDEKWDRDGFELTEENLKEAIWKLIPYAYDREIKVLVVKQGKGKL